MRDCRMKVLSVQKVVGIGVLLQHAQGHARLGHQLFLLADTLLCSFFLSGAHERGLRAYRSMLPVGDIYSLDDFWRFGTCFSKMGI